jgi:alginate O-acetyltransferase complex protein AlgI
VGRQIWQRVATFHLVCLGWVFFRADSFGTALTLLRRLVTAFGPTPLVTPLVVVAIAFGIGVQYLPKDLPDRVSDLLSSLRPMALGAALGISLFVITTLGPQGVAPFIYYRF